MGTTSRREGPPASGLLQRSGRRVREGVVLQIDPRRRPQWGNYVVARDRADHGLRVVGAVNGAVVLGVVTRVLLEL